MDFPQLLTEAEAADWLGVPIEAVALWARDGKLLAAARTEGDHPAFVAGFQRTLEALREAGVPEG
jgi:hypothetical protein